MENKCRKHNKSLQIVNSGICVFIDQWNEVQNIEDLISLMGH